MKVATLCYVRAHGATLMLHRVKRHNDMHAGKWNGLGGKLHPGESPEECVIREVEEESGLRIHHPEWRGILTFPDFSAGEDWYAYVFVARSFTGTPTDSSEGNLKWIADDQLLELELWEGDRVFIPWLDGPAFFSGKFTYKDGDLSGYEAHFYVPYYVRR